MCNFSIFLILGEYVNWLDHFLLYYSYVIKTLNQYILFHAFLILGEYWSNQFKQCLIVFLISNK